MSHPWERPNGEGEVAEAVATVACVLLLATGSFRTNAMPAGAGEVEKCCALHLGFCRRARTAFLAGYNRSILSGEGVESGRREKEKRSVQRDASIGSAQLFMGGCRRTSKTLIIPWFGAGGYCGIVDLWMNHFWAQNVRLLARIGACKDVGKEDRGTTETERPISAQA
jgi:hypothetical protein